jgi:hypothetical protein
MTLYCLFLGVMWQRNSLRGYATICKVEGLIPMGSLDLSSLQLYYRPGGKAGNLTAICEQNV